MKAKLRISAAPLTVFTQSAADSLVGKKPRLNIREFDGGEVLKDFGEATVTAAEVVDNGSAIVITYEAPDEVLRLANMVHEGLLFAPTDGSLSFKPTPPKQRSLD